MPALFRPYVQARRFPRRCNRDPLFLARAWAALDHTINADGFAAYDLGEAMTPLLAAVLGHNFGLADELYFEMGPVPQLRAASFDGTDDVVTVAADASIANIFDGGGEVECYIRPTNAGENNAGRIYDHGGNSSRGSILFTNNPSGGASKIDFLQYFGGVDGQWRTDNTVVTDNTHHHIKLTYNSDSVTNIPTLEVDGVAVAFSRISAEPTGTRSSNASDNLLIGDHAGSVRCFNGLIDEFKMTKAGALVLHLGFDEASGNALDASGNGNDGVFTNATRSTSVYSTLSELLTVAAGRIFHEIAVPTSARYARLRKVSPAGTETMVNFLLADRLLSARVQAMLAARYAA